MNSHLTFIFSTRCLKLRYLKKRMNIESITFRLDRLFGRKINVRRRKERELSKLARREPWQ